MFRLWWARAVAVAVPGLLLAVALWVLLASALRWLGRLAAYGYATFYTGLDAVAGIAVGTVKHDSGGVSPLTARLFEIGDVLGYVGAWCFLVGSVCVVADVAWHKGLCGHPGAGLLLVASVSFLDSHLFEPRGVFTMAAVSVGMVLLSVARHSNRPPTWS
jgi:hypothetical protein